jgi:antitoxin ParD1/3/4
MRKNTSFSLGEHFSDFIETQVESGRYETASDVIRASLRLLEEREAELADLRAALIEGEKSGPGRPFDVDKFLARMHEDVTRKSAASEKKKASRR